MKKHQDYRQACLRSTYFDPNGKESLMTVNDRWGNPFKMPTLYRHMQHHQKRDIERSERMAKINGEPSKVWQRNTNKSLVVPEKEDILENTVQVVEAVDIVPKTRYEIGLDEFIDFGRDRLKHNEMAISAANYIAAIKVKADIDSRKKDRKLDLMRSMFAGAAPKKEGEPDGGGRDQDVNGD